MSGSSVTLVFYHLNDKWWTEPTLNLIAAAAQSSTITHVEIAIGEAPAGGGQMSNVLRIFNDPAGVELTSRTGKNPSYTYLSLGCSKAAEQRMLNWARQQVGKPFSNIGMARSLIAPRQTDQNTFFCAELVAAALQVGGLMALDSNPGAATPASLFKLYSTQAAAHGNPYVLRTGGFQIAGLTQSMRGSSAVSGGFQFVQQSAPKPAYTAPKRSLSFSSHASQSFQKSNYKMLPARPSSPPRASFKVLNNGASGFSISLAGLNSCALR